MFADPDDRSGVITAPSLGFSLIRLSISSMQSPRTQASTTPLVPVFTVLINTGYSGVEIAVSARHSSGAPGHNLRSEEHTSELQSRGQPVCRLLLEQTRRD